MSSDPNTVELSVLRAFSPLDGLKNENLRALEAGLSWEPPGADAIRAQLGAPAPKTQAA